jgi:hypothetical protein
VDVFDEVSVKSHPLLEQMQASSLKTEYQIPPLIMMRSLKEQPENCRLVLAIQKNGISTSLR